MVVVVVVVAPLPSPWMAPALALESVITVSPLSFERGDSPTPPPHPPSHPQRCHLTPDRAIHLLLCVPTPGAPITMATAELIATLIPTEVQPAEPGTPPPPGQEGREVKGVGLGSPLLYCCI
jgi:hypothetical protein